MRLVKVTKELEGLYSDYYLDLIKMHEEQAESLYKALGFKELYKVMIYE